ncbi:hypothetical protein PVAND_012156 [Polypedilum vanderplanki]|uniref:Iron-binding zinc finger CDGSH type domain-containing protein n=1 Tax=Polypedilum vanderplanki TaxID=319348 RepID=A0A9J6CLK5_POLVA|nr:hypothetical protein PVAND_012156 [Polypedilum vanderplanki]
MSALKLVRNPINCIYRSFYTSPKYLCKPEIPRNVIEDFQSSQNQTKPGVVYDKKPFRMNLKKDKLYSWCFCGKSKSQPLCDGTHKLTQYKIEQKPVRFQVEKDGDYYLCLCKQTKNKPFCDGTHKTLT